jgi:hypothetical protein
VVIAGGVRPAQGDVVAVVVHLKPAATVPAPFGRGVDGCRSASRPGRRRSTLATHLRTPERGRGHPSKRIQRTAPRRPGGPVRGVIGKRASTRACHRASTARHEHGRAVRWGEREPATEPRQHAIRMAGQLDGGVSQRRGRPREPSAPTPIRRAPDPAGARRKQTREAGVVSRGEKSKGAAKVCKPSTRPR